MAKNRGTEYPKDYTLYMRIDPAFKEYLQKQADARGLKLAAYARMKLMEATNYTPGKK